ncbi:DUF6587 family protein [Herminiimonas aquatilis]|uniref:DUF6587 family protein n=1 Tax=Herminiimonas aquatilis TaxID=345342 RepID=A0ABW2J818_9BURK
MSMYGFVQNAIISIVVLMSALYVLRKLMPKWVRGRQLALASMLNQPSHSLPLRKLGSFMMPDETSGGGCGSGCSSCSNCASNPASDSQDISGNKPEAAVETRPLEFQRHI